MQSQVGPSSKELKTVEEYDKFLANKEVGIIGLYPNLILVVDFLQSRGL